ncbi:hypothetical protein GCM10027346_41460 [Hymenobacter seoulensis]
MPAEINAGHLPDLSPAAVAALDKFLGFIDDMGATRDTTRRLLFELLRMKTTLSTDELETLWAIEELLSDLDKARRTQ